MGEIADEHYDAIMDSEWGFSRRRFDTESTCSRCNRCGEIGLFWQQRGDRWHLFKMRGLTMSPHTCDPKRLHKNATSAFDNLD